MAVSWRITFFQTKIGWNPYFYSVLGSARFLGQVVKKGNFWTPPQKENLSDNWKAFFLVFLCLFTFSFFCFFLFFFLRATSLGPKPSLLILSYSFVFVFFFVPFLSLLLIKKPVFPLKGALFVYFLCFSFFLPQPSLTSPFFCFSFSVSLSCSCLSFFLLVILLCFLLVSCFCLFFIFLSSLLLLSEKNNMKILNCNLFFLQSFLFYMVSCFVFPFKSLFLVLVFFFLVMFFVQHECFWFQNKQLKKHNFLVKRGVATKRFFYQPVFCKMWKDIVLFWPFICPILVDVQNTL